MNNTVKSNVSLFMKVVLWVSMVLIAYVPSLVNLWLCRGLLQDDFLSGAYIAVLLFCGFLVIKQSYLCVFISKSFKFEKLLIVVSATMVVAMIILSGLNYASREILLAIGIISLVITSISTTLVYNMGYHWYPISARCLMEPLYCELLRDAGTAEGFWDSNPTVDLTAELDKEPLNPEAHSWEELDENDPELSDKPFWYEPTMFDVKVENSEGSNPTEELDKLSTESVDGSTEESNEE